MSQLETNGKCKALRLPVELFDLILGFVSTKDLCSVRLTCRTFNIHGTSRLFRTLQLNLLEKKDCNLLALMLKDAGPTASNINITSYVRHLVIESRSPRRRNSSILKPPGIEPLGVEVIKEELISEVAMPTVLASSVGKLQNLQSLRWESRSHPLKISDTCLANVIGVLPTLPILKEVSVEIFLDTGNPHPNLSVLKNLHSLHVRLLGIESGAANYVKSDIIPAVAASPILKSLHIMCPYLDHKPLTSSNDLMEAVSGLWVAGGSTRKHIRDLGLVGIPLKMSTEFSWVLQNLRHLTLSHIKLFDISATMTGIPWGQIWDALYDAGANHGIWLETLDTEGTQPASGLTALFRYLRSHPGLKKLALRRPPLEKLIDHAIDDFQTVPEPNPRIFEAENLINSEFANEFWSTILPRFTHSLTELQVDPLNQSPWCYGPTASEALRQCARLRKLAISVCEVDKDWATKKTASIAVSNINTADTRTIFDTLWEELPPVNWSLVESGPVLVALDMAEMPLLKHVSLILAEPDESWGWCGTGMMEQISFLRQKTNQTLRRFIPWQGYPHILTGPDAILKFPGMDIDIDYDVSG